MLKKSIKTKLILSLVIFTLLVMSIFFIILNQYLRDYSLKETENTILFLGENASSYLQKPLFDGNYNQLKNIARPLLLTDFDYLIIYDNTTGNSALVEEKKEIGISDILFLDELLKNKTNFEKENLYLNGENYIQYLFPITSLGITRPLGFLIIGSSVERIKSKLAGITRRILLISIMLFLSLTITIYLLSDKFVKPIKKLSETFETFSSGNYSVRSDIKTNDETRVLSDNFNIMANKINEQIFSIERYSKNLEKMVQERTDELLKAMDAIKERDKKLIQAEKISSLNSLVSSIAHEINNPLAIISGNLQMLDIKTEDPRLKRKLDAAEDAVQRIARLIDDINFFSAIKDISITRVSFSNLMANVVNKVVPPDISLTIDGVEDDHIYSNSNLLTVSLENILKNSVEIIRSRNINGKIHIRYSRDDIYFTVEIIDNAGGVEEPEKVFNPFYTTSVQKKGLGLTFVYHAIQALSGELSIENIVSDASEIPDETGSKFTIMLPVDELNQEKDHDQDSMCN